MATATYLLPGYGSEEVQKTAKGILHSLRLGMEEKIFADLKQSVNFSSEFLVKHRR
jgi:hypothetical protein